MKNPCTHFIKRKFLLAAFFALQITAFGQGRVVVNEFMAWPRCGTTSEFIELLNFGPGPMNIGCYIVTNGTYAVTIPPNTILQPRQYFLISGVDVLVRNCGNMDSSVRVNLNWNTCNCADRPVPITGDGFMKDGGGANEKIILLDPNLKVVDAVSRNATPSTSIPITTSTISGNCTAKTFDLDTMAISYETIGISTGINNSYSRRVDGDCGWMKTPDISAGAANKTGSSSSASYSFTTVSAAECTGTAGFVSIGVSAANVTSLFPMTYILAFDSDSNGVFTETDRYIHGIDATPSAIDVHDLNYGRYRITVGSSLGCNLQSFDFFIFNCYGIILPLRPNPPVTEPLPAPPSVSKLWPNPVTSQLSVQLPATGFGRFDYTITNFTGLPVKRGHFDARPGINKYTVNTNDLSPGIYLFSVPGNSITPAVTLRFIKN